MATMRLELPALHPAGAPSGPAQPWWRGAVIYEVYPRSFQDGNGDGIGDLRGVRRRLPYLARLGVDAIWIAPFFRSPMKDFGYDISDHRDVDPIFGTLDDLDELVEAAHEQGLKVLIDQVPSHCSDRHPWFAESRASRDNARADWFVWAEPRPDGAPPNNWLSVFGGSAWQWDTRRRQYYLHHFLASQPDLNFHHPDVQQAVLGNLRFWLERGIDGVRLDAINFCFHDPLLRSNPPRHGLAHDASVPLVSPYALQRHVYDKSRPENLEFLRRVRRLIDEYPGTTTIGEIGDDHALTRIAEYTSGGDKLHMAYGFDLLGPRGDARHVHAVVKAFERDVRDGWACWPLSNHDVVRVASRWPAPGGEAHRAAWLRVICALQLCLRGSPCIYQGDELGLSEAEIAFADLRDPYGLAMWPEFRGRDGCRTPMVWSAAAPHAGFGDGAAPWLPIPGEHLPLAVDLQEADPHSLVNFYRGMLAWRRAHPVLRCGSIELLDADNAVLAFVRRGGGDTQPLLCALNLGASEAHYALPGTIARGALDITHPLPPGRLEGRLLVLPPFGALFAMLA